jgi:hypothetical protein
MAKILVVMVILLVIVYLLAGGHISLYDLLVNWK